MEDLRPVPASRHCKNSVFVHKELMKSTHVFLRVDMVRRPLQPPYDGPFKVITRNNKFFTILMKGKEQNVSIDRVKPAFILNHCNDTEIPSADKVQKVEPASKPCLRTGTTTRSGRKVRFIVPVK